MENFNGTFGNNDPKHDNWILPKGENIFAKSRGEGIRLKYNSVVESKKDLPRGIINTTKGRHRTKVDYKIQKP